MTYRLRSSMSPPDNYWSGGRHSSVGHMERPMVVDGAQRNRKTSMASTMSRVDRKYIDPWDLENYEYIHRTIKSSPEPSSPNESTTMQSPAGEPIPSTFFYVPSGGLNGSDDDDYEDRPHELRMHPADDDGPHDGHIHGDFATEVYDCTTGCYAGLDEELFYNAKYESIHDDPAYSLYYTDIESSSTDRTSSSGGSSVSTLQLHTPGFGVRASGRRSIVLPKPEPHIEFPPAPPTHEYYDSFPPSHHHHPIMLPPLQPAHHLHHDDLSYGTFPRHPDGPPSSSAGPLGSEANTYCSLTECGYDCVPDHVPVYAISNPATLRRQSSAGCPPVQQPPNNFGLSKRGLLQIDYSFNWNNLYRFISK